MTPTGGGRRGSVDVAALRRTQELEKTYFGGGLGAAKTRPNTVSGRPPARSMVHAWHALLEQRAQGGLVSFSERHTHSSASKNCCVFVQAVKACIHQA